MEIVNQKVVHEKFGEGIITWFGGKPQNKNKYIRVEFVEKSIELPYPAAFKTHLRALDSEFARTIIIELNKTEETKRVKNEEAQASTTQTLSPVRLLTEQQLIFSPSRSDNVLRIGHSFGTNSRDAYMKCCNLFGWDKSEAKNFGRKGALLYAKRATPEGYSPWFISNHNLERTKGGKWNNTIEGDFIYEQWDEADERLWNDKTIRIVFLKLRGNYSFFGVFCVDNIELKENGKYTKTYKRVSKEYSN